MSEKKVGKRLLTWVLVLVMTLSLLPLNVLADELESGRAPIYGQYVNGQWVEDPNSGGTIKPNVQGIDSVSKTAKCIGDNKYKVTLEVVMSETEENVSTGAATVLVIDISNSMKWCSVHGEPALGERCDHLFCKAPSRLEAAQDAAKDFVDTYADTTAEGIGRYLSIVVFNYNAKTQLGWTDVSTSNGKETALDAIDAITYSDNNNDGGTNLEQGLARAKELLNGKTVSSLPKNNKNVVALTDGAPTRAGANSYTSEGSQEINDATEETAESVKNLAHLYTVCFGAENERTWKKYHPDSLFSGHYEYGPTVGVFLRDSIATNAKHAFNADNTEQLNKAFSDISSAITSGLSSGTVYDSLPDKGVTADKDFDEVWELKPEDADVDTSGATKTYTYTKTYTVTIDPTDDAVAGKEYYPLNGETRLEVEGHDPIDFPIPAGKVVMPTYPVTWKNYNGETLKSKDFKHGTPAAEVEEYEPEVSESFEDAEYTYTFTGWTPDYEDVTEPQTYTANYDKEARAYTVSYQYDDTAPAGAPALPADEPHQYNTEVNVKDEPTLDGYRFSGWTTKDADVNGNSFTMPAKNVTFTGSWEATEFLLTINYVYEDGTKAAEPHTEKVQCNTTYSVTSPELDGYTADTPVVSGTMPAEPVTVTVTYTKRSDLSYTVNYYWNGTADKAAESKTVENQTFGTEVTESPIAIEGYTPVSNDSKAITIGTDSNVITFYYYKNVKLTANSKTEPYDGTEKSVSGFTGAPEDADFSSITVGATGIASGNYPAEFPEGTVGTVDKTEKYIVKKCTDGKLTISSIADKVTVTITGHTGSAIYDGKEHKVTGYDVSIDNALYKEADFTFSGTAEAKGTDAGTYPMNLKAEQFTNTNTNFTNVEFVVTDGKLTISSITDKVTVTITGHTDSAIYDGKEHKVTGYDVTSSNALYTTDDFTFSGNAEAKGINAGTYEMGLTAAQFTNNSKNFSNVEFIVTNGKLTIHKRGDTTIDGNEAVTITANSNSVDYDGKEHGENGFTSANLAPNQDVKSVTITGSEINAGRYPGKLVPSAAVIVDNSGNDVTANYVITYANGDLEIKAIADKVTVTIKGNTDSVRYNGKEHKVEGYQVESISNNLYTADSFTFSGTAVAKGTKVGTYPMGLKAEQFKNTNTNFTNVEFVVTDGKLTITRRPSNPQPPTVEIPDDDALGLNTTDHFAYVVGYGNGEVRPQNNITRAEVATIFFRLLTDEVRDANLSKTNRYTDVMGTDWYNTAVSTLSSMGIITGYPDGTFRPNAAITRAEFAAIAARFDSNGDKTTAKFSDIATHWAKDEISIAYNNGWITGYPNGTFGPQRDITRAETMTLVNRVLNRQPETEDDLLPNMTVWTDNADPKAWYYLAVQEATNSHYYEFKTNSQYEKWTELRETRDWTQLEK